MKSIRQVALEVWHSIWKASVDQAIYRINVLFPFRSRTERDHIDIKIENKRKRHVRFEIQNNIMMF